MGKPKFTDEELKRRGAERVAAALKHFWEEKEDLNHHSRMFQYLFRDELYDLGPSVELQKAKDSGEVKKEYQEHIVPLVWMRDTADKMFKENQTEKEVADMLECCFRIAWLTAEEAKQLNKINKTGMPTGWDWKTGKPEDRLEKAGIHLAGPST